MSDRRNAGVFKSHRTLAFLTPSQVWDGISDARISFSAADLPLQTPEMSRMTENLNLQRGLLKHLLRTPEVQLLDNVRVTAIEKEGEANGWPLVRLSNGQTFRTRLLVSPNTPDGLDIGSNPIPGRCGWAELTCTRIRGHYDPWVGLRHTRCSCYTLARSSRTLSTPKYHRIPTFPTHRTYRLPPPLPNRVIHGLVDQACLGCCAEICGPLGACELDQRCFPAAGSFNPLPTRPPSLVR